MTILGVAWCMDHVLFMSPHYSARTATSTNWLEDLRRADDVPGAMAALWGIVVYPPQLGVGLWFSVLSLLHLPRQDILFFPGFLQGLIDTRCSRKQRASLRQNFSRFEGIPKARFTSDSDAAIWVPE